MMLFLAGIGVGMAVTVFLVAAGRSTGLAAERYLDSQRSHPDAGTAGWTPPSLRTSTHVVRFPVRES